MEIRLEIKAKGMNFPVNQTFGKLIEIEKEEMETTEGI